MFVCDNMSWMVKVNIVKVTLSMIMLNVGMIMLNVTLTILTLTFQLDEHFSSRVEQTLFKQDISNIRQCSICAAAVLI